MTLQHPLVSFGVPVYQGENYLDWTLDAIRTQSYRNLEILVSDNASTDGTAGVVDEHSSDPRVRLITQTENVGAAENYNVVFRESNGKYFVWNAHDDFFSSDFVEAAVDALEANPEAVVAIGAPFWVDEDGEKIGPIPVPEGIDSTAPAKRFAAAAKGAPAALVFGLYRSRDLARSHLHQPFTGSDRNLVAEMMLYGSAVYAGASEFYLREHEGRSVRRLHAQEKRRFSHSRESWYAPSRDGRIVFPSWRRVGAYLAAVGRAPLSVQDRVRCFGVVPGLLLHDRLRLAKMMIRDLVVAVVTSVSYLRARVAADDRTE